MKKLVLVRHAKSSWAEPGLRDFDRPLNDRGEKDAPEMGRRLKVKGFMPDLVVTSPALRAITTCEIICRVIGYPPGKIQTQKRVYHADHEQLLSVIQEFEEVITVMLVGHNPGFTLFANALFGEEIENIPTCGVVGGTLNIKTWSEADWGCGKMELFDSPKSSF